MVTELAGGKAVPDVSGRAAGKMATYLYAEESLLVFIRSEQLQHSSNMLTNIFDWVGLITNFGKMVSVVCHP